MQVGLLSDTHGFLDEAIFTYFEKCDEVWHAGDFGPAVLDRLKTFKPVRGVFGNVDGAEIRAEFPRDLEWQCEGARLHDPHRGGIRAVTVHVRSARGIPTQAGSVHMPAFTHRPRHARSETKIAAHESWSLRSHRLARETHGNTFYD